MILPSNHLLCILDPSTKQSFVNPSHLDQLKLKADQLGFPWLQKMALHDPPVSSRSFKTSLLGELSMTMWG